MTIKLVLVLYGVGAYFTMHISYQFFQAELHPGSRPYDNLKIHFHDARFQPVLFEVVIGLNCVVGHLIQVSMSTTLNCKI